MNFDQYYWQPYNYNFRQLYKEEEKKLKKILDNKINIEHFGSTAVPGLGGKGIIDIIIGTELKKMLEISKKIQESYSYKPNNSNKNKLFFQYIYPGIIPRKVHIHLVELGGDDWVSKISLRNFLIKYRKISEEYNELKKKEIDLLENEKEIYAEARKYFLDVLTKQAVKEYGK